MAQSRSSSTYYSIALALLVLSLARASDAQFIPIGQPGSEIYYKLAQRERSLFPDADTDFQLAPFVAESATNSTGVFPWWPTQENELRWFLTPGESMSAADGQRALAYERLRGGVSARISDKLSAISAFALDETLAQDTGYHGKVWRGLAGDVETAALAYRAGGLKLLFGRFRVSWGPSYTNPLLSQEAAPLDGYSNGLV